MRRLFIGISACLLVTSTIHGNDWPQFRGPNGTGIVKQIEHPLKWSDQENVAWKTEIEGGGLSAPIVVGDRVLITSVVGAALPMNFAGGVSNMRPKLPTGPIKFRVACLNLKSGKQIWEKTLAEERPKHPIHSSNSFATASPASDGNRFFVYFASIGRVFGLDMDGKQIWDKDVGSYPTGNGFGPGSSITVGLGCVYVQCDNDKKSFLVALNSTNGEEKWKNDRKGRTSWSTPLLWRNKDRVELIVCGSGYVTSYDPKSGKTLWNLTGISSAFSASPAADDQQLFFGNSGPRSSGPLVAVDSKMSGDSELDPGKSGGSVAWSKLRSGPGMSSPVVVDGCLYIPSRGVMTCYDCKSGEQIYKERLPLKSTAAAMWGGKGVVFLMDETGKCLAIQTGPEFKILETSKINDQFWSSPSVAGKSLILRGKTTVYCIR